MFIADDHTYNDIRKKSLLQWLEEMEHHEDVAVRGGVPLVRGYLESLERENARLLDENELKNQYMRKIAKNRDC